MLFVSGSNDTLHYPMFLRALNFIMLFFQTSIFPCKMGIYMWKPLTMGRRFGQRLTLLGMRKEGFLNKRCQTLFILHTDGLETRLLKSTITATEQLLKMKLGYILKLIINKNENEKYYYNYFTKLNIKLFFRFLKRSESTLFLSESVPLVEVSTYHIT